MKIKGDLYRIFGQSWREWYTEYFDGQEKVSEGTGSHGFSRKRASICYELTTTTMLVLSVDGGFGAVRSTADSWGGAAVHPACDP